MAKLLRKNSLKWSVVPLPLPRSQCSLESDLCSTILQLQDHFYCARQCKITWEENQEISVETTDLGDKSAKITMTQNIATPVSNICISSTSSELLDGKFSVSVNPPNESKVQNYSKTKISSQSDSVNEVNLQNKKENNYNKKLSPILLIPQRTTQYR